MPRKTIGVTTVREIVNRRLAVPDSALYMKAPGKDRDLSPEEAFRVGTYSLLEEILHTTGNYRGFGYPEMNVTGNRAEIKDETRRVLLLNEG